MLLRAAARRGTAAAAGARALSAAPVIPGGLAEGAADRYVGGRRPDSEKEREGAGMPAEQAAKEEADPPGATPSMDSLRYMMGKANEAVGGGPDFPESGGDTVRGMAGEIGSNTVKPLERAAAAAGARVTGVADAAVGVGRKVMSAAKRAVCGTASAPDAAGRAVEGGGGGLHGVAESAEEGERGGDGGAGRGTGGVDGRTATP